MTRRAVVVGAGVGGLAAAVGLERQGWRVTVLEKRSGLATAGTGFGIWPQALQALERWGLDSELGRVSRVQADGSFRKPDGRAFGAISMEQIVRRAGRPVELVARRDLLAVLCASLVASEIEFDTPVPDASALMRDHDLVVVADGLNSQTRARLWGTRHRVRHAGTAVWRGLAPLDVGEASETWGRACKFGITPLGPEQTNWYAVVAADDGWEPDSPSEFLLDRFGSWHHPIPQILAQFHRSDVLHHHLYYLAPALPTYVRHNMAIIGDAAHAMTPDLGQGACQALIDGLVLAECVDGEDVAAGLREFDRQRRPPTQRLSRLALLANRLGRVHTLTPVRDLVLRLSLMAGPPV